MARLFGTDGVRGEAGVYPLDEAGAEAIGRAAGEVFAEPGETAVISADPRESSPWIVESVTRGLIDMGVNVVNTDVMPTPGLALATRDHKYALGVMVTASHNPYSDTGIKLFARGGNKLDDGVEDQVEQYIRNGVPSRSPRGARYEGAHHRQEYEDFLVASAGNVAFDGMRIGIDTGHGAASGLAERVFGRLGANVVAIGNKPDGRNINAGFGAMQPQALQRLVREHGLDLGVGYDGDADRALMVDEESGLLNGDKIMYILAKTRGDKLVIATEMTNLGTEQAMAREGIALDRRKVGDRYVLEGLQETGAKLGGEQAGHIIIPDILATGDGMLASIQIVRAVRESGISLAEWSAQVPQLPQSLVNIPADRTRLQHPMVAEFIAAKKAEMNGNGRLLIRPSGTEPLARVMVESPDAAARAEAYAAELRALLTRVAAQE